MGKLLQGCLAAVLLFQAGPAAVFAQPQPEPRHAVTDHTSTIVQQGLTIHELDKELSRLKEEEISLNERLEGQRETIRKHSALLDLRTTSAGEVLRAYYMGQRDRLWMLLFKMRSFSETLMALDYLRVMVSNDFRILEAYKQANQQHRTLLAELEMHSGQLQRTIAEYEKQRERLVAIQEELDRQLAEMPEELRTAELAQIAAATRTWEEEGIPVFEQVMNALSLAMTELPSVLSDPAFLTVNGSNMEVRITDEHLNAFLKERDPLFEQFQFAFNQDGMTVNGAYHGHEVTFAGNYRLEQQPVNALRFQIEQITFNDYELPDTTSAALQERFDFTFAPSRIMAGLTVSDVVNEAGQMRVQLAISFAGRT